MGKKQSVRARLTIGILNDLSPGDVVYDERIPNLGVRVSAKGKRTFFVLGKGGERATIGPYPQFTVEMARKAGQEINQQFAAGTSPRKQRLLRQRREAQELTFRDVWEDYRLHRARKRPGTDSYALESQWRAHLSRWGEMKLSDMTIEEVRPFFLKLRRKTPVAANRAQRQGKAMFNHAISELKWKGDNPFLFAQASEVGRERDRAVSRSELERLFAALDELPNQTMADLFRMCVYTGQRIGNVRQMRHSEIDWDEGTWAFGQTKQGSRHRIVLPTRALQLLKKRKPRNDYFFPGRLKGEPLSKSGYRKAWLNVLERAGIEGLTVHDLRSVHATQALEAGFLDQIQKHLGHSSPEMTQRYLRPMADAQRAMLDAALNNAMAPTK